MRFLIATSLGGRLNTLTRPRLGYSRPRIILMVVLLPEPFGPSRPKISPERTSKSRSLTARTRDRRQKSLKTLVRPTHEMIGKPSTRFLRLGPRHAAGALLPALPLGLDLFEWVAVEDELQLLRVARDEEHFVFAAAQDRVAHANPQP